MENEFLESLLNKFDTAAKHWGWAQEAEGLPNRALLSARNKYYKARKELWDHAHALSRTIVELESKDG